MAITRAQQAKQMLQDGGRIGLQGGGADMGKVSTGKGISPGRSQAQFGHAGHAGKTVDQAKSDQRLGNDRPNEGPGSNPFAGHTKTEEKGFRKQQEINKKIASGTFETPAKSNFLKNIITNRKKTAYNLSRKLPFATQSSFKNLTDFRNYLISQGADTSTIDRLMEGVDEDNPISYENFQELVYDDGGYQPKGITDIDKLRSIFKDPTRDPFEKLTAVPQNFSEFMLTQKNNPNLFTAGDVGNFKDMPKPKDLVNPNTGELYTNTEWNDLKREIVQDRGLNGGDGPQDPCKGPNPPAYCFIGQSADETQEDVITRNLAGLTPRIGGSMFDFTGMADGGLADMDREAFLLGGIAKGLKKAVRGVKKIVKSPLGKAALIGAGFGLAGMGPFKGLAGLRGTLLGQAGSRVGEAFIPYKEGLLTKLGLTKGGGSFMPTFKGGITLASILPLLAGKTDEEKDDILKDYYASQKLIPSTTSRQAGSEFDFYEYNLAEGGMPSKEPVAKKVMPLLDMDGMEKDYRAEGGFVPIGRMEKADDVPARLSKNEFVFTADAVRNAGEGDVDKGAEVMYNMMKNLESGGEVSEESQGLDGAREMFKTSQRLGEVI